MKKISIIDCNIGNRASIRNMLKKIGYNAIITQDKNDILSSDLIILPGVGAFDAFMQSLHHFDLINVLNKAVLNKKTPVLGICLGMQVLFEKSEEGDLPGLGWIKGKVCSLTKVFGSDLKLPHIGWKEVIPTQHSFLPQNAQYYFVHNYFCHPEDTESTIGEILIDGKKVVVAVRRENTYGVQFHPEKSHKYGFEFFESFLNHVLS